MSMRQAMTLAPFIAANNRALYVMSARPETSGASPCTPKTCFERLDLYVAVATCHQASGLERGGLPRFVSKAIVALARPG